MKAPSTTAQVIPLPGMSVRETAQAIGTAITTDIAAEINSSIENIGARRLQTVMERVLDEISFEATDRSGDAVVVDAAYVEKHIGDLARNADLSRFIL